MSARPLNRSQLAEDALEDFMGFSLKAIHDLQAEVKQLRAENARLQAELEEYQRAVREAF